MDKEDLKEIMIDVSSSIPESEKKKPIWKYGYNEKHDVVVIGKTGTIGQVVVIEGLRIALPRIPAKNKIGNYKKKKQDQRWIRQEMPEDLQDFNSDEEFGLMGDDFVEAYMPYIQEEFERRRNGYWFFNNGEETYLTGEQYMFLQWSRLQHSYYPEYRYPQRVLFYHWAACVADKRCLGQAYLKNRRSGYSTMCMSNAVNFVTQNHSVTAGVISKTSEDAKKMFMNMGTPIFKYYPFFFKPLQDGSSNPRVELALREPSTRITAKNKSTKRSSEGLNSILTHTTTTLNAFDSQEINFLIIDEAGKWPKECPLDKYLPIGIKTMMKGTKAVGNMALGSTPNSHDKGGAEFREVFNDSKLDTRNKVTQRTKSQLYALHIPADYNLSGFFDIYGNCILEDHPEGIVNDLGEITHVGSTSFLNARREQLKNDEDQLNEELRMDSSTERHAFLTGTGDCLFNSNKIEEQLYYNDTKKNKRTGKSDLIERGNLIWVKKYETVRWIPDNRGKFLISHHIPPNLQNNYEFRNGVRYPGNTGLFAAGIDSYDISAVTDGRGSKGSLHVVSKNTYANAPNKFLMEYCDRPPNVDTFIDNCLKAVVYYGCQSLTENNKPKLLYDWKRNGFRKYSANRPDKKFHRLSVTEKELGGIPSSSGTIPSHAEFIENFILKHVGVNTVPEFGQVGKMGECYFNDLLLDWLTFDINNREKFDRTVSSGYALWLANKIPPPDNPKKGKVYKYF